MTDWVGRDAIKLARRAPLYNFLLAKHPNEVTIEGDSLRPDRDHSVSIRQGYSGFTDFADFSTGNAVECLMRYFGYGFTDAVAVLCEFAGMTDEDIAAGPQAIDLGRLDSVVGVDGGSAPHSPPRPAPVPAAPEPPEEPRIFDPPKPAREPYRQMVLYLTQQRYIPAGVIRTLIDRGLLYQSEPYGNAVFMNVARTMAEIRGTAGSPFHGLASGSASDVYWAFVPGAPDGPAYRAFICESAIDAISLYLLRRSSGAGTPNDMYCSIAGVAQHKRIDAIAAAMDAAGGQAILAVDNDAAGDKCRARYAGLPSLRPAAKDWNQDWIDAVKAGRITA